MTGIAEANSDFESVPGKKTIPARRNANQIPVPITEAAKDGKTNNPDPILAATVTIITPTSVSERLMVDFTSETTPVKSPFNNFPAVDFTSIVSSLSIYILFDKHP